MGLVEKDEDRMKRTGYKPELQPLSEKELDDFFRDIDRDNNGYVTFEELEAKLEEVHQEIAPEPRSHHLHHPERRKETSQATHTADAEKWGRSTDPEHDGLHAFLCHLMPSCSSHISQDEFKALVRTWDIPSQDQTDAASDDRQNIDYEQHLPLSRRLRAHWSVEGPKALFIASVVALQLAFGIWQMVKYIRDPTARRALGWGVILAKAAAGALYPTMFFMVLSMSRWFSTFMRRYYWVSRFVNWDLSQAFHIWIACTGLALASLHAIGHLTGTFLYGSRPAQQSTLALIVGEEGVPKSYIGFVRTLPGWSGITALGLFWTIALLSMPYVRRWSYEIFQLGHLLMFPFLGLLCAHGTAKIFQAPMMGYWLAFPTLLVLLERTHRHFYRTFVPVTARLEILDDDTVVLYCKHPRDKAWRYQAGQYVFLQVPSVSYFQWHPFTISACRGSKLQLHIKTDGDWTSKLRDLPTDTDLRVGIDGPFGAPAQRFYDFDRSLIIGAGVGITPFSAILTDLEGEMSEEKDPWRRSRRSSRLPGLSSVSTAVSDDSNNNGDEKPPTNSSDVSPQHARRVDFHWLVRDKNYLLWFSSLMNRAHDLSTSLSSSPSTSSSALTLNITPHITMRRKNISTHIFRYLLDRYRTPTSPYSALTGLKMTSHFGRPDFEAILGQFLEDLRREGWQGRNVGVFFCGAPALGRVLSDLCAELTVRERGEGGGGVRFVFIMEVFG